MSSISDSQIEAIRSFVRDGAGADDQPVEAAADPLWREFRAVGTELWLDTGDVDAASQRWCSEMTALTTNNTLLNREIQKGIYDELIAEADGMLEGLDTAARVREIAFILNAWHGRRLVRRFDADVSVELHTDLAHDLAGIVHYGRRFHDVEPDRFIVKVPLTATGLLGARKLRQEGIRVNFTLEFSARQNAVVSVVTHANYCNVFLGRLGAYVADHGLGDGTNVGEKATIASQRIVRELTGTRETPTRQIAASLRDAEQLFALGGVDVFTMPTAVADVAREAATAGEPAGMVTDRVPTDYEVSLARGVDPEEVRLEKLWEVTEEVVAFARSCDEDPPDSGAALTSRARGMGVGDLFPDMSVGQLHQITADGKIPRHDRWKGRIRAEEAAIDSLLNLAGLASFASDQAALDARIAELIA